MHASHPSRARACCFCPRAEQQQGRAARKTKRAARGLLPSDRAKPGPGSVRGARYSSAYRRAATSSGRFSLDATTTCALGAVISAYAVRRDQAEALLLSRSSVWDRSLSPLM
jgi:hypothetical protein